MSINDLVKEEAQRQIDLAIEEIPSDRSKTEQQGQDFNTETYQIF